MKRYRFRWLIHWGIALIVLAGSFSFYVFTGPADIAWTEGADYQRRIALTNIGEGPWDKPLYVCLSQPFLLIPWESLPRRASLASAAFAATTCLFIFLLMKVLLEVAPQFISRRVGLLAAITLCVAHTFWLRAVAPGPEVLDALLLSAILYSLVRFANEGKVVTFYAAMMILGLSLSNNLMMGFLFPVFAIWVRVAKPPLIEDIGMVRFRGLLVLIAGSALAFAVTAWGWWAAGFSIPAERLSWLTEWQDHMMLAWDAPLQRSLARFGTMLLYNFPPWTVIIGFIGLTELFRRQKYVFWLIVPLGIVHSFLAVTLTLADPFPAYLPSWVLFSVAVGYGWWKVLSESRWKGFVFALLLSLAPLLLYRYAVEGVERVGQEVQVRTLLGLPIGAPVDSLDNFLNPDRRHRPDARAFAREMLSQIPVGARVATPSRTGAHLVAPARYLADVEQAKVVNFAAIQTDAPEALQQWAAQETPLFLAGLHPPHPAVENLLDRYQFVPVGYLFRVEPRRPTVAQEPAELAVPVPIAGEWSGFVRPQGFPVDFLIQEVSGGSFTGKAILNRGGARPLEGRFTRISLIVESVLGRITYDEKVHIHIDAKQIGDLIEGTWLVFEAPFLNGSFSLRKK
jgi:hypothetical protein